MPRETETSTDFCRDAMAALEASIGFAHEIMGITKLLATLGPAAVTPGIRRKMSERLATMSAFLNTVDLTKRS